MRFRPTPLLLLPALVWLPLAAPADTAREPEARREALSRMNEQLEAMDDQLRAAEGQLEATRARVDEQRGELEALGLDAERTARSGLSAFIEATEIRSWVATSYNYNFASTDDDLMAMGGQNVPLIHHPNPHTFQLDQFWLEIDKQANEESRALFHVDIAAGVATDGATDRGEMEPGLHSAYVGYLAPLCSGVEIRAGLLPTLLGVERVQTNANFHVTRGIVFARQPTTNLGVVVESELGAGFTLALGAQNSPIDNDLPTGGFDTNGAKALTSRILYRGETWFASGAVNWGKAAAPASVSGIANGVENDWVMLLDVVMRFDPLDNLSAWINYDYERVVDEDIPLSTDSGRSSTHAIAVAARLGVLEATGFAARFEYLQTDDEDAGQQQQYSLTGTFDHELAEDLTAKAEIRYDGARPGIYTARAVSSVGTRETNVVGLLQLMYEF